MSAGKKIIKLTFIVFVLFIAFLAWRLFGSTTSFEEDKKILYIKTGSNFSRVETQLEKGGFVSHSRIFRRAASFAGYDKNIKPGRYVIEKGSSIYGIVQLLKLGKQTPVTLLITKLRTRDDLIQKLASNLQCLIHIQSWKLSFV